jgi:glycosyltransferase involved in cell wall biosynthesis
MAHDTNFRRAHALRPEAKAVKLGPVRIGVDVRELRRGTSTGIGRYLRAFLRYARENPGGRTFVFYGDEETDAAGLDWSPLRRLSSSWPLADHRELPALLREDKADLFFSPYYKAPWNCPCPSVVTIHDLMFLRVPGGALQALKNPLEKAAAKHYALQAAGIVTVSEHSKRDIQELLGVDGAKIRVVYNVVPERFAPAPSELRAAAMERLGVPEGFLLCVGGLKVSKNVGALIDACRALPENLRRAHPLLLAAPRDSSYGGFSARWKRPMEEAGARFLPPLADDELIALYSACAVCVVPSLYEGFGMPALEAMACGAPVLSSNRSSLPEVVGDAGELCDPDAESLSAALARLLGNPSRLEDLRRRGPARARTFSYAAAGQSLLSFLDRCAGAAQ